MLTEEFIFFVNLYNWQIRSKPIMTMTTIRQTNPTATVGRQSQQTATNRVSKPMSCCVKAMTTPWMRVVRRQFIAEWVHVINQASKYEAQKMTIPRHSTPLDHSPMQGAGTTTTGEIAKTGVALKNVETWLHPGAL